MFHNFSTNKKFFMVVAFFIIGMFGMSLFAQEKKDNDLKSKLDKIKGKIEKLTVKVDGKDLVFEGKDAEELVEKMKSGADKKLMWISEDDEMVEGEGSHVIIRKLKGDEKFDIKRIGEQKKIKVEDKDGKKVVTVTTTIDGKEETKVYEGEEADKILKEEKGMKRIEILTEGDHAKIIKGGKDHVIMFGEKSDEDFVCMEGKGVNKKVKVEVKDGKKKVSVTTTKEGKEETKVYEGEEAEKFLKDEKENTCVRIITEGDDDMPQDRIMYFNRMNRGGCNCSCCGGDRHSGMMMHMPFSGKNMKHMIIKEFKEDDEKSEKVEKKVEKN